jgi:hypothetical protein
MIRPTLRQRALAGRDIKVRVRTGYKGLGPIRATYLEHVPFHHGLGKGPRSKIRQWYAGPRVTRWRGE